MTEFKSPVVQVAEMRREFRDISEYMDDPKIDEALSFVLKLGNNANVPVHLVGPMIVRLQALASELSMLAKFYTVFEKGGENVKRKHTYYTLEAALNNIVNSLKYLAK